jgi:hypothetical protein
MDFMQECGKAAKRVLDLKAAGKLKDATDVLMCEANRIAEATGTSYADAKQTIGFCLQIAV